MTDLDIELAQAMKLPMFTLAGYTFVDGRHDFSPSTDWLQGGELIELFGISLKSMKDGWMASCGDAVYFDGEPLVAAMRVLNEYFAKARRH